jgi:hypothetical protein
MNRKMISVVRRALCVSAAMSIALALFGGSAGAFMAHKLREGRWVIECRDGAVFSYAGSASGLSVVGTALCKDHAGLATLPNGEPSEKSEIKNK